MTRYLGRYGVAVAVAFSGDHGSRGLFHGGHNRKMLKWLAACDRNHGPSCMFDADTGTLSRLADSWQAGIDSQESVEKQTMVLVKADTRLHHDNDHSVANIKAP